MKKYISLLVTGLLGLVALPASASTGGIDVSAAVTEITNAQNALAAVGGAVIVLAAIALTWRWVKASFF